MVYDAGSRSRKYIGLGSGTAQLCCGGGAQGIGTPCMISGRIGLLEIKQNLHVKPFTPKCGRTARASPPVLLLPVIFQSVLNPSVRIREVAEYK